MKILVTGGGGFVGLALCKRLLSEGHDVRSVSRKQYQVLEELGVEQFQVDLGALGSSQPKAVETMLEALSGVDAVFHTAALVKMWGARDDFFQINVEGTRMLLELAQREGVSSFVYTSSPSVVADGSNLRAVDETKPYPDEFHAYYPETKSLAERLVLKANAEGFATCALRPHLIFGPGDTNLIPTVLEKAKAGTLRILGEGKNLVDFCFIEDCVAAHCLALTALKSNPKSRGRAYFISQGDPVPLWDWINRLLTLKGESRITKRVSPRIAYIAASISEFFARYTPFLKEPRLTRFLVEEMSTDHYFDISAAEKELGFIPSVGVFEALEMTLPLQRQSDQLQERAA